MLKIVIVAQDPRLSIELIRLSLEFNSVSVVQTFDHYPSSLQLTRVLRSTEPQILIVDTTSQSQVASIAHHVSRVAPTCQLIAASAENEKSGPDWLLRAGIKEFLSLPSTPEAFEEVLSRAGVNAAHQPISVRSTDLVYAFLPAKPGVGATSLALNSSLRLASRAGSSALLCDFDLQSGIIRFLLKLRGNRSTADAMKKAADMDRHGWSDFIERVGYLDVLHGGDFNPEAEFDHLYTQHLIDFARRNYHVLCFDLPGTIDRISLDLIHESRRTFLVSTGEACSLHLAAGKVEYLQRMGLGDRVTVLLNRHAKRNSISIAEVEDIVGAPVFMTFPNDYTRLSRSIAEGKPVDGSSELGQQCEALADYMLNRKAKTPSSPVRQSTDGFHEASASLPGGLKAPMQTSALRSLSALA